MINNQGYNELCDELKAFGECMLLLADKLKTDDTCSLEYAYALVYLMRTRFGRRVVTQLGVGVPKNLAMTRAYAWVQTNMDDILVNVKEEKNAE